MKAKILALMGVLAVLSGCFHKNEDMDIESLALADVSYSVEGTRLVLNSNLIFETDRVTLRPGAVKALRVLYRQIDQEYFSHISILAHCDNTITERSALEVTNFQAQVIAGYLWFRGVDAAEIDSKGRGFAEPIADMDTVDGIHVNQRIEIFLT